MPNPIMPYLKQHAEQARNLQQNGETAMAAALLQLIIEAAVTAGNESAEEANALIGSILQHQPTAADMFRYYGIMQNCRGNHQEARHALEMALVLESQRADLQVTYGRILCEQGMLMEAHRA